MEDARQRRGKRSGGSSPALGTEEAITQMIGISEGLDNNGRKQLLEALWRTLLERPTISGDGATHYHGEVHFHGPVAYHGNVFYGSTHYHHPEGGALEKTPGAADADSEAVVKDAEDSERG